MEYRKRRTAKGKRRMILRLLLVFGLLAVVVAGVVAVVLMLHKSTVSEAPLTEMRFTNADKRCFTGAGFLYIQNGTLYYDDLYNEKNDYYAPVTGEGVTLCGSSTLHALYNSAALKIVGASYPVEFTGQLLYVDCGAQYVAALRTDVSGAETVQVFDKTGAQKDQIESGGQFIEDFGFYTAGSEYLYVLTLSLDSGTPLSTVAVYDMTHAATSGVMQVQNQLIEDIYFTANGIFAVGTNQIIRYSLTGNPESYRETVYGWDVMDFENASSPMFLLRPRSSQKPGTVKLLTLKDADVAGTAQRLLQLPAGTVGAFVMDGKLVAVTEHGFSVYGSDGKIASERSVAVSVEEAKKLDSTTLLLRSGDKFYTVKVA
jgi:hypothetical protein